ncbi:hypothetical protein ACLB1E_08905 [Escherichia coli]
MFVSIQVPTTLLSQVVDSSISSKLLMTVPCRYNMIGAFYQPASVVVRIELSENASPA